MQLTWRGRVSWQGACRGRRVCALCGLYRGSFPPARAWSGGWVCPACRSRYAAR
ncbi:DUF3039 domain-containing protein [Thalassovita taeanensis]|uniref:DUF3039 domain-containing protein n=1 Tax=Thalassovita taeanensis TaxID=657014 RepID=UPI003CCBA7F6